MEVEIQDLYATWSVSGIVPAESNQKATPIVVDFVLLDGMSTYAFSNIKSVSAILDEQAILLKTIENSIYVEPFVREIRELDSYQRKLRSFIEEASTLQESYIQLYPQFVTGMLGKIPGAAARLKLSTSNGEI